MGYPNIFQVIYFNLFIGHESCEGPEFSEDFKLPNIIGPQKGNIVCNLYFFS